LGASTGLDGKSLKYYLGASWMQGRSQRFVISAGLAGSQLQVPVNSQSVGKILNSIEYPITQAVVLSPAWKVGAFVSFTFNLTNSNKNQDQTLLSRATLGSQLVVLPDFILPVTDGTIAG
jgi:hypothetical protein